MQDLLQMPRLRCFQTSDVEACPGVDYGPISLEGLLTDYRTLTKKVQLITEYHVQLRISTARLGTSTVGLRKNGHILMCPCLRCTGEP